MTERVNYTSSFPTDDDRNTDLHYAAANGNLDKVINELSLGQKIDAENYLGWTPLMMAVRRGHWNVVQYLLEHRADATRKNFFGVSVFLMAVAHGKIELVHLILQHLLNGGVSRMKLESTLSPLSLTILFRRNCITPLMFAAALDNVKAQKMLIEKGADTTLKSIVGQTYNDIINTKRQKTNAHPSPLPQPQEISVPLVVLTPQPAFLNISPIDQATFRNRKSSDVATPQCFFTPHLTPIALPPQIFFPPNFSPSQVHVASPQYVLPPMSCDKLLMPKTDYYYSPCVNFRIMENSWDNSYGSFLSYSDTSATQ